jgi:hypothetical protein
MEEFELDVRCSFKFITRATSEDALYSMEREELRSLVYANLPGKTAQSPRDIDEIEILDIKRRDNEGNTVAFPKHRG